MPAGERGGVKTAPKPVEATSEHSVKPALQGPVEPPHPVLQQAGFQGGIKAFNEKAQAVVDAHRHGYGHDPSPALVLDVVRSPVPAEQYPVLFEVPKSKNQARLRGVANQAEVSDQVDPFFRPFNPLEDVGQRRALDKSVKGERQRLLAQRLQYEITRKYADDPQRAHRELLAAGFLGGNKGTFKEPYGPAGFLAVTIGQVADSLAHSPGGIYELGKAGYLDAKDFETGKDVTPSRTAKIGKAVVRGMKEDVTHPTERPGYLFLDILGFSGLIGGAASRLATTSKATTFGEAVSGLAKRPQGGTFPLTKGEHTENVLLSDNPAAKFVQTKILERRQKGLDERHEAADLSVPSIARAFLVPRKVNRFVEKNFSAERKLGREMDARKRVEIDLLTAVQRDVVAAGGWSVNQSRILSRIPNKARKGLTRGEQKAIFVQSIDDVDPIATETAFHHRMIEQGVGEAKDHRRHIADLQLAKKALENPRPRFVQALALVREAVDEMERIKIQELGLSPVTAESRVANLGNVLRGEGVVPGAERVSERSFYMPTVPRALSKKPARFGYRSGRVGPFGIAPPRPLPELTHEFTGDAIRAGDIRIDATHLVGEAYGRTVRAATIRNDHATLLKASTATRRSEFDRPIRTVTKIPEKLKSLLQSIDEGQVTAAEADKLHPRDIQSLVEYLYPGKLNARTGRYEVESGDIEGVRWVDSRLLAADAARIPHVPGLPAKVAGIINTPIRVARLFLRPAYILNLLGNAGQLLLDEGPLAVPNVMRAMHAKELYGPRVDRSLDALAGNTKSLSYVGDVSTRVAQADQALAHGWSKITDADMRKASVIHYLRRKGYKTREQLEAVLKDHKNPDVVEASRRGNKAMVEFDNLTWVEKDYIRHFIFVYPWVSRSLVWSLRTMVEHPVKTDILAHLGEYAEENEDPVFKQVPAWFKRAGYFTTGWTHDGKPKVVNPTSVNTFSTLESLLTTSKALFTKEPYASVGDTLGPAAEFAGHLQSGKDQYGNDYPSGDFQGAAWEVLTGLPQVIAHQNANRAKEPGGQFDITSRSSLVTKQHAALKESVFSPGWLGGYGSLIAGGLSPRTFNPDAAAARFWRDQPPLERLKHERDLIDQALTLQGGFLERPVPKGVRAAIGFAGQLAVRDMKFKIENGRDPTDAEKAHADIKSYLDAGKITPEQAATMSKRIGKMVTKQELQTFRADLYADHGGGKAVAAWDADVRLLASFSKKVLAPKTESLRKQGLIDTANLGSQKDLYAAGREFVKFKTELAKRAKAVADERDPSQKAFEAADLRAWVSKHDKPLRGLGVSPVRLAWAYLTEKEQAAELHSRAGSSWASLSSFDKELMGKKTSPVVDEGWAAYQYNVMRYRTDTGIPADDRKLANDQKLGLVKQLDKTYPGLLKDYLFSRQPLFQRIAVLNPVVKSPNRRDWAWILSQAKAFHQAVKDETVTKSAALVQWKDAVKNQFVPFIEKERPGFARELAQYSPSLLYSLLS